MIDVHNSIHGKGQTALGPLHHLEDGLVWIEAEWQFVILERDVELDGYFMNIRALTLMLFPYVFQVTTRDEHQVVVAYDLARIAHYTANTCSAAYEIQLHHIVAVDGIVHLLFVAVGHIYKVVLSQWGYLMQHLRFHFMYF